ncbi:hypothetical protein BC826DRAFT_90917 [Russula brevipes]|nr:hypothetical protein BC826DRAFT_90917 [Russula brevipes]
MASHQGKRRIESDDTAPTRVKLRVSRSQGEEQQDVEMASTSADLQQGLSSPTQETTHVALVDLSRRELEIMPDMLSDEASAELNSDAEGFCPWMDNRKEAFRTQFRVHLLHFLCQNYDQIAHKYRDYSALEELLTENSWLIPVIDKHWKEGSFHAIRRLRESL